MSYKTDYELSDVSVHDGFGKVQKMTHCKHNVHLMLQ